MVVKNILPSQTYVDMGIEEEMIFMNLQVLLQRLEYFATKSHSIQTFLWTLCFIGY